MLVSAVLVALVGVLMKSAQDKLVFRGVLSASSACLVLPFAFILPLPTESVWPYLLAGAVVHFFYQICYVGAFERGDMSLVYPIMRGVAPAITAVFAFLFLNEGLTGIEQIGLGLTVVALIAFSWRSNSSDGLQSSAILIAIVCGVFIALYCVIDAAGMRVSEEALSQVWTYIVWFFLLDMIGMAVLVFWRRGASAFQQIQRHFRNGFLAGGISLFSFSLALYAFTLAPVAKMSAMRETSVVFGAIFAAWLLKEPFGQKRILLAVLLASGLLMLQSGGYE